MATRPWVLVWLVRLIYLERLMSSTQDSLRNAAQSGHIGTVVTETALLQRAADEIASLELEIAWMRSKLHLAEIDISDLKAISRSRYEDLQRLRALLGERAS